MISYLKTLYSSMKLAAYYAEVARRTPDHQLRDEMAALLSIKS
jgi:hypothetical protein